MASVSLDPIATMLAHEESADHGKARQRGERVDNLAASLISEMHASGYLRGDHEDVRVSLVRILVDDLYGNQAVDLPRSRR